MQTRIILRKKRDDFNKTKNTIAYNNFITKLKKDPAKLKLYK